MSLARSAGRGAVWQILGGGGQTVIRLGASMVLARQLGPADFGIFGMAHIVYGLFDLLSASGMTSGIIAKKEPSREDLSTCFWTIFFMRLLIFSVICLSAPLIANFIGNEDLVEPLRAVSVLLLITGMGSVSQALMNKKLHFKQLAMIKSFGVLLESCLAVVLVLLTDLRYWALIIAMLTAVLINTLLIIIYGRWFPSLMFCRNSFRYLFRFGINSMGSSITSYLSNNFDYLIVGKMLGTKMLGYYEFAYRIPHMINERISGPAGMVFFPAIATIKDDDTRVVSGYFKASKYVAWVALPALAGLALLSPLLVEFMWGEKWMVIVDPLRILCVSAAISSVLQFANPVFLCKDRPDLALKFDLFSLVLSFFTVGALGYFWGLKGVAIGMLLAKVSNLMASHFALKMVDSRLVDLLAHLFRPLFSTFLMVIVVYLFKLLMFMAGFKSVFALFFCIAVGVLAYICVVKIIYNDEFKEILSSAKALA